MRVIAGSARSLNLIAPRGDGTRPTAERIKETLFNILAPYVPDSLVLDLFAGSGGLGIEALSRGAAGAYFIENSPEACRCISENLRFTKLDERAILLKRDVLGGLRYLATCGELKERYFDLIFMDPPYHEGYEERVFNSLAAQKYVGEETFIILEAAADADPGQFLKEPFFVEREKKYKTNKHLFIRKR